MARISGVDLPREKRIEIGLTYIYGIGLKTSQNILANTGVNPDVRVKDLTETDISKLREYIDHNITVEGDLRREVSMNIKSMIEIGSYRGVRHRNRLPRRRIWRLAAASDIEAGCQIHQTCGRTWSSQLRGNEYHDR